MKRTMAVLTIFLLSITSYALTKEDVYDVKTYLFIQEETAEKLSSMLDDLDEELATAGLAHDKLIQWKTRYTSETEPVPRDAEKLDSLMKDYFSQIEAYLKAHDAEDEQNAATLKAEFQETYRQIKKEENNLSDKIDSYGTSLGEIIPPR